MITWDDRIRKFLEAWDTWSDLPNNFRVDRALKAAGFRDVIKENSELREAAWNYLAATNTLALRPESDEIAAATVKAHHELTKMLDTTRPVC